jgi:hypothetical protein
MVSRRLKKALKDQKRGLGKIKMVGATGLEPVTSTV